MHMKGEGIFMGNYNVVSSVGKALSPATKGVYKSVISRLGNGYGTTKGISGPVTDMAKKSLRGLENVSKQTFLEFVYSNPAIASVSERVYGTEVTQRALLGSASDRIRTIVDASRNDNGGLFRAIFDKSGKLRKIFSVGKDGSTVSTILSKDYVDGIGMVNLSKKTVRAEDGQKLREVFRIASVNDPKTSYTFVVDAETGLTQRFNSRKDGVSVWGQVRKLFNKQTGQPCLEKGEYISVYAKGKETQTGSAAGIGGSLKSAYERIQEDWQKFLKSKLS